MAAASVAGVVVPATQVFAEEKMTLERAKELIAYANKEKNFAEFNIAYAAILELKLDEAKQNELLAQLPAWNDVVTPDVQKGLDMIVALSKKLELREYDTTEAYLRKEIKNARNMQYLLGELTSWGRRGVYTEDVTVAVDSIVKVWTDKTEASEKAAKETIAKVKNANNVAYLNEQLAEASEKVVREVKIDSVTATKSNTVKVTFNTQVKDVDFTNFDVNGGLTVVKATLLSDNKTVEVEVNNNFTRNQEYVLTASNISNLSDVVSGDLTGKFTWSVEEGVVVSLKKGSLNKGEKSGVSVKDESGKDIAGAQVSLESSNNNIITTAGTTIADAEITAINEGSADITVTVTLPDGTVLTNTFKVTVNVSPDQVVNQGYTLVDAITDAPENTVEFNNGDKATSMYAQEIKYVAMYNTTNGDPETKHVDFTDATVRSLNPIIATAAVSGSELIVTANAGQAGKASFEVTFKDKTKRTFSVDVKKEKVLTDIYVDTTTVKLSDETKATTATEGVNEKTVNFKLYDQYGKLIAKPTEFGKITVTTNTDGLVLTGVNGDNTLDVAPAGTASFKITSTKDKIVSGRVEVKYFKNITDTKPTSTKTINVTVVDVNLATAIPTSLDIAVPSEIDANADHTAIADYKDIKFTSLTAFVLDQKGNRIDAVAPSSAVAKDTLKASDWIEVTADTLQFKTDALTFMSAPGSVNVNVTANGITKTIPVKFKNSALVPHKVTVDAKPVAIKLASTDTNISFEEILFGKIDKDQLIEDTDMSAFIAVKKAAKNGGYKYNKSLITVSDINNKVISAGANLYGIPSTTATGNIWNTESYFSANGFDVDFSIANWVHSGNVAAPTTANLTDTVAVTAGQAATFTLVIKSIKVAGDASDDANLLAAPVTINVTVTK